MPLDSAADLRFHLKDITEVKLWLFIKDMLKWYAHQC